MIGATCAQEGIDLQMANNLYKQIRREQLHPAVFKWEDAVKDILE